LAFVALAAFIGFAALADLAAFTAVAGLAGLAFRLPLARLAGRLVGRLAEPFAERFAPFVLGRPADRRLRAADDGFFRRVAFALAMTRPFGTLTVCR
jgi:hypothetical protein